MVRTAPYYRELESEIRKIIGEELDRGKIDFSLNIDSLGENKSFSLNQELATAYYKDFKSFNDKIGENSADYLALILRMQDVFNNEKEELQAAEKEWVLNLVKKACQQLNDFRRQEGDALALEFKQRIDGIDHLLAQVPKYESERVQIVKERIFKGLEELNATVDQNRLEQEMIFYIEKLDVSEEKMRLKNHLDYFIETMKLPKSGRKLGFITQEIGREINTLGSKSNHSEMQKLVVEMKDNLEKIKEQVLNTL
jgi:uncharacterized protein (TIGR00255 family)